MASSLSPTTIKRKIPTENSNTNVNQAKKPHWSAVLSSAINDESVQLYKDDLCTVIQDKFPKVCSRYIFVILLIHVFSIRLVFIYLLCLMNILLI